MCLLHREESQGHGHLEKSRKGQVDGRGSSWSKPAGFLRVMGRGWPKANPAFEDGDVWDAAGRLSGMRPAAAPRLCTEGQRHTRTPSTAGSFWVAGGGRIGDLHGNSKFLSAGREAFGSQTPEPWESCLPRKNSQVFVCIFCSSANCCGTSMKSEML